MKILKIAGRNLASLAGDFAVDFESEPLASSGLFAISGPTGAGKSTLLDALCLALYGTTPRLPKSARGGSALPDAGGEAVSTFDPRNLLRRGAAEAYAEVDFVGNDGQRYRARWSVRRSRNKASGLLQASHTSLHRLPELTALGGTKSEALLEIANRIGLSFEQFTRSVLLAQNEFSAFLKTDENERGELLETLTGSTIYSDISRRAFERYKGEQEAMRHLARKLADQAPLPPDERSLVDTELAAATVSLAALDASKRVLEQQQRWHHELARLLAGVAQATLVETNTISQVEQATPRWRRLATLDAVQEARPMAADLARLAQEAMQAQQAVLAQEAGLTQALDAHKMAVLEASAANDRVAAADAAQRAAAPMLDDAKRLDATVAALAPLHQQADSARAAAQQQTADNHTALNASAAHIAATERSLAEGADWLAAHAEVATLAEQWPRWDRLLVQAEAAGVQLAVSAAALSDAQKAADLAGKQVARHAALLATAHATLAQRELARQQANAALAGFDMIILGSTREEADTRREALLVAERTWLLLASTHTQHAEACAQAATLEQAGASALATLAAAKEAAPALAAGAQQAERSLAAAELACAGNVVDLRATLVDDAPCPVCGSATHPYQHQDARLEDMLENLRTEVRRCRQQLQDNLAARASAGAAHENIVERLPQLQRDRDRLATSLAELEAEWEAEPLAAMAPPVPQRSAWFTGQLAEVREAIRTVDQREQSARQAALARDAAQHAWEQAQTAHAQLQHAAHGDSTLLARLDAELAAQSSKHGTALAALATLLDELDAVLAPVVPDWRTDWARGPATFRAARAHAVETWRGRTNAQTALAATLATQQAAHGTLVERASHVHAAATEAERVFGARDDTLRARRHERAALWNHRPVAVIEQELVQAIVTARDALQQQGALVQAAAQAEGAARNALVQAHDRVSSLQAEATSITARLAEWLEDFANTSSHSTGSGAGSADCVDNTDSADSTDRTEKIDKTDSADSSDNTDNNLYEPVTSLVELHNLLAVGTAWIAQERAALAELAANVARAATVRAERQDQTARHLAARIDSAQNDPTQADASTVAPLTLEQVDAALATLLVQRNQAHEQVSGLRLQTAQDDARRRDAAAVLAEIEAQQAVEQRWGRLSELIGSADGKKFRNYAQQFTLDVLLGYANSHLAQLARRYRLERVMVGNAPSLALMVRDQDMGGEIRSVNSLSGGESFLVSLALALGLASLSSNRVRVESLFIDEGFGSLDSETLGVAMDALDALQSMGRKVGVISHVQEMTERISAKILVRPAGGGSSAVTVSV
ncbi:MAG: AAA family ATPase [Pseudomonadota bacterium]|nr:AAA family ATPase [Pseudomonadota bacterium]